MLCLGQLAFGKLSFNLVGKLTVCFSLSSFSEKVDLELPNTESDLQPAQALELPEDAKMIFREKTVTSLSDTTAGATVFKKRKFENGKSRNIRQRLNDH